jgi:thiol:disulfide interchange protein DsbD
MSALVRFQQMVGVALAALAWLASPVHASDTGDILDPQDAFKFSAALADGGRTVEARFSIADGYYLYQERFTFTASDGVQLGSPHYPAGKIKFDDTFKRQLVIYRGDVVVKLPVHSGNGPFSFTARLQGCADRGVCYPPDARTARLVLSATSDARTTALREAKVGEGSGASRRSFTSDQVGLR